ncbi:MAG: tRNA (adenosine(37)-N6)-threonylcarbamoyltransferase complex ATPase subunit type 1 TsaE [Propionibacteriaceae bacterium]|jgi:tRNA threonylcarbamoyladenosine biosynthesis protein TsaE|nr:tRNA (adenosine(37)-N6)-threonylcarbamoyltransferase complex ATPase subunit type 1 TsaE [Propionibacteriaceae bacterium]
MTAPVRLSVPTEADMHALGHDLARLSRSGDLIILTGELGAGKTQLAQGIGEALKVEGAVISPTFVVSRIHPGPDGGLGLVHVDAYRLGGPEEIDDLDLEAWMPGNVTVVEWGAGVADHLSGDHLDVEIERAEDPIDETRQVTVTPVGPRWDHLLAQWEQIVNEDMGRDGAADARGDADE